MTDALAELLPGFHRRPNGRKRRSHDSLERHGDMVFEILKRGSSNWRLRVIDYRATRPSQTDDGYVLADDDGMLCWETHHGTKSDARAWIELIVGDVLYVDEEYSAIAPVQLPIGDWKLNR